VFFEKKRIYEGKEKTELRIRQEKAFPRGRNLDTWRGAWMRDDQHSYYDDLGRFVITSASGKVLHLLG